MKFFISIVLLLAPCSTLYAIEYRKVIYKSSANKRLGTSYQVVLKKKYIKNTKKLDRRYLAIKYRPVAIYIVVELLDKNQLVIDKLYVPSRSNKKYVLDWEPPKKDIEIFPPCDSKKICYSRGYWMMYSKDDDTVWGLGVKLENVNFGLDLKAIFMARIRGFGKDHGKLDHFLVGVVKGKLKLLWKARNYGGHWAMYSNIIKINQHKDVLVYRASQFYYSQKGKFDNYESLILHWNLDQQKFSRYTKRINNYQLRVGLFDTIKDARQFRDKYNKCMAYFIMAPDPKTGNNLDPQNDKKIILFYEYITETKAKQALKDLSKCNIERKISLEKSYFKYRKRLF